MTSPHPSSDGAALTVHAPTSRPLPAGNPADGRGRVFCFIGTAADHLLIAEKAIAEARATHSPVRRLLDRRRKLKARAAALGAKAGGDAAPDQITTS